MTKKQTLLELVSEAGNDAWIASLTTDPAEIGPLHPYWNANRKLIAKHSDEDIAEMIANRPTSREAELGRSIMRVREGWRMPARWSLIVAGLALILSVAAFIRTL